MHTDELVWSKLETGRLPSLMELKEIVSEPSQAFSSPSSIIDADQFSESEEVDSFYS